MPTAIHYRPRERTARIIIHDSHTKPDIEDIDGVTVWHKKAEDASGHMGLVTCGYHYVIERDGRIVIMRPKDLVGAHTSGHNMDSIGICWVGGRDAQGRADENCTYEQRKAIIRLCQELMDHYGKKLHIKGHSEVQAYRDASMPKCPMMDMNQLREDISLYAQGIAL